MLPFEFTVSGPPVSHWSRNKVRLAAWRRSVRSAAARLWPTVDPALDQPLRLTVTYYHEKPTVLFDTDNLVKPVQDALIGYLYTDDRLILDSRVHKRPIDGACKVRRMSKVLADAFVLGEEFLHVRIEAADDPRSLP